MKRIAVIYSPITFLCLAVALVNGEEAFIILAGINAVLGVVALLLARRFARDAKSGEVASRVDRSQGALRGTGGRWRTVTPRSSSATS